MSDKIITGGGTEYLLRRRFELLKRKEDEEMKEWVKIFDETITVAEPTKKITRPLLQSCKGMTEMYALLSITANKDETDKTGNDNGILFIGYMGVSYGRLCDMSNNCDVIVHSTHVNEKFTFFERSVANNALIYNSANVQNGYFDCSSMLPDYDNFILSPSSRPYKGTIKARVFAR